MERSEHPLSLSLINPPFSGEKPLTKADFPRSPHKPLNTQVSKDSWLFDMVHGMSWHGRLVDMSCKAESDMSMMND